MFWEDFALKSCHSPSSPEVASIDIGPGIKKNKKKKRPDKASECVWDIANDYHLGATTVG